MRCPAFAERGERARRRHAAQAVGEAKAVAHAEVVDRQHVRTPELEDQQHLDGPASDAAHLRQALDDFAVAERHERRAVRHDAVFGLCREILQARDLRERQAHGAQFVIGPRDDSRRQRKLAVAAQRDEAPEDALGGDAVQLLMRDRARERFERRARGLGCEPVGPRRADQRGHHRIARGEMLSHR